MRSLALRKQMNLARRRTMLAALADADLRDFVGCWNEEFKALLDCELLRRGFLTRNGINDIIDYWDEYPIPVSVPELKVEIRKARQIKNKTKRAAEGRP